MRTLLLLPLFLFACEGKQVIGADSGPIGSDDDTGLNGDDADADTDTDTDADSDADSDTDTDTDTDADTTPVEDSLEGNTYVVDIANANIVEPAGVGGIIGSFIDQELMVGVQSETATEIEMIGALSVGGSSPAEQDYCLPSIDFPTADFSDNPDFSIGPADALFVVSGYEVTFSEFQLSGTFAADGSDFHDGVLAASIDSRNVDAAMGQPEGTVCTYASSLGTGCETCPSDGEEYCLSFRAEDVVGERQSSTTVYEVQGTNCDGCESGPPAADAVCD